MLHKRAKDPVPWETLSEVPLEQLQVYPRALKASMKHRRSKRQISYWDTTESGISMAVTVTLPQNQPSWDPEELVFDVKAVAKETRHASCVPPLNVRVYLNSGYETCLCWSDLRKELQYTDPERQSYL